MTQSKNDDTRGDEELERVTEEIAGHLAALGISLTGRERPEDLVRLQDAIRRFENAVESRGGDLMMDEGPHGRTREPDDPHFKLPQRDLHESVNHYLERLARATDDVLRHRPLT
jgi:hypothetical protein